MEAHLSVEGFEGRAVAVGLHYRLDAGSVVKEVTFGFSAQGSYVGKENGEARTAPTLGAAVGALRTPTAV